MKARTGTMGSLARYLPMPRGFRVGNQHWAVSCQEIDADSGGGAVLLWVLSGPHERQRTVRMRLDLERLLAGGYDAGRAAELVRQWLPYSDRDEVLEISGRDLLRAGQLPRPSDDEV